MSQADGAPSGSVPVELVDEPPTRVRQRLDLFRLATLLVVIAVFAVLGTVATDTLQGANDDLRRVLGTAPGVLIRLIKLVGSLFALAVPIALMIREIVRGRFRRLVESLGAGLLAIAVIALLNVAAAAISGSRLHSSLIFVNEGGAPRPLDAYLAAVVALVTMVGAGGEPVWRALSWTGIGIYVVSAFLAGQASLLSLIISPFVGAAVAIALRYLMGVTGQRPDVGRIAAELLARGIELVKLERRPAANGPARRYRGTTPTGELLDVHIIDRDLIATGVVYSLYRRLRVREEVTAPVALSLEAIAERRSLLAMGARSAGVRMPSFVAGVSCGPDAIALVYDHLTDRELRQPSDDQLADLWHNAELLHRARMTHRGLAADRILVDDGGRVVLPVPREGAVFATELRISLSRAQLLIASAQLAGAKRAVAAARSYLTDRQVNAIIPFLQPVALPRETRAALKKDKSLLGSVRDEIQAQTRQQPPEPVRIERFRPRTIVSIAALLIAAYLIVGQLGSVDLATVFSTADWRWVPFVLLASAATYFAAALSLSGFVTERLPFLRTVLVQVASSFAGFITPPSVGGLAINLRFLRRQNLSPAAATTSLSLSQVVNAVIHAALLIVLATATGTQSSHSLAIPGWVFIALGCTAIVVAVLLAVPAPRRWLLSRTLPVVREAVPRLVDLVTNPAKLSAALGGALLLNACYFAALWFATRAFGGNLGFLTIAVIYLAGAAVGSVAPTPGGLGAVEVALSTGLTAAGMSGAAAVSAVLLYRVATFWLPVPAGWVCFHFLRHQDAL